MTAAPALRLVTAREEEAELAPGFRPSMRLQRVAELLDCDPSHLRQLLAAGDLEGHRIGKRGIRIYCDSVQAYQEGRPLRLTLSGRPKAPARSRRRGALRNQAYRILRELGGI